MLKRATDARLFQRVQAVPWVAQGDTISEVAELMGVREQTVYNWLQRYRACHQVAALADTPRRGRPVTAPQMTSTQLLQHLRCNPLHLGYRTTVWSVKLLAAPLSRQYDCPITPYTLRRRMKALGLRWKRPRYFYEEKAPHRAQKKGAIVRRLRQLPAPTVLLGEDETVLRLFPALRRAWALQGEQAHVTMTGCNAKRVLFGAINLRTGHGVVLYRPNMEQAHFQPSLRLVREAYPGCPIALLLDEAPGQCAATRQRPRCPTRHCAHR